MKFENVCIESLGYHLPENIVTSEDLERRMGALYEKLKLPYGRLELMSGIRERRFWDKGVYPSEVSSIAGENALKKSSINRDEIGSLICASVCRDFLEPATATVIHHNLNLPQDCAVFDISNACLGVLNGMITIANQIEAGQIRAGLVVSGENGGPLVNNTVENLLSQPSPTRNTIKTAFASLTIGSAAVAVLLAHKDLSRTGHRLLGGVSRADTRHNHLCRGNEDTGMDMTAQPLMETDAETLMHEGIRLGAETWEVFKAEMGWTNDQIDRTFCHQVGSLHRKMMLDTFDLDPENDFTTLEFLGNTGSAALPVTLAIGEEKGFLKQGDRIALLGIGSGLNCMMLGAEW
ncbi:MAG: 3-oxoacyl-ACP synthase III [Nitrospina sp.]|nr:3-oxoacyl-ACP synthase III [Nitrospina sp.]